MDRLIADGYIQPVQDEKQFDVKHTAIHSGPAKDFLASIAAETLEAALAINDGFLENNQVSEQLQAQAHDSPPFRFALLISSPPDDRRILTGVKQRKH